MNRVMKAMVLTGHGGFDRYEWREDWPVPVPGPMEVLIAVGACGLNNTDVNTRTGWYSRTVTDATTGDARAGLDAGDAGWGGRPIVFPRIQGANVDIAGGCMHLRVTQKLADNRQSFAEGQRTRRNSMAEVVEFSRR